MAFIRLTDLHVPAEETLFGLSPRARLGALIDVINAEHSDAEFVLITGDLTHAGSPAAYRALSGMLARLKLPVHLMLGNHDARKPFFETFDSPRDPNGFVQFVIQTEGGPVICLDTVDEGQGSHGRLCPARLDWLRQQIAALPPGPWMLAMHHPPMDLGLANMDRIKLRDGDTLWQVLAPRPPAQMLIGHVHRPISGAWHGVPFQIQPAVSHQVAYRATMTPKLMLADEPAALSIVSFGTEGPLIQERRPGSEGLAFPNG
ncbi:MAG: phosphodiesterase [Pseudomonadota bacterium]